MQRNSKRIAILAATLAALAIPAVAQAGNPINSQTVIARYEGVAFNRVHITSMTGGETGNGTGWDCQSWWIWQTGEVFYSYNMQWFYSFTYKNNGSLVALGSAHTNGTAC